MGRSQFGDNSTQLNIEISVLKKCPKGSVLKNNSTQFKTIQHEIQCPKKSVVKKKTIQHNLTSNGNTHFVREHFLPSVTLYFLFQKIGSKLKTNVTNLRKQRHKDLPYFIHFQTDVEQRRETTPEGPA